MHKMVLINSKGGVGKSTLTLAIAEVLQAQIVDFDGHKTITSAGKLTGLHKPIGEEEASARYIVYDTPSYKDVALKGLLQTADYIVVPSLISYPDLIGVKSIIDEIRCLKLKDKTTILFNKVKAPTSSNYKIVKNFFIKNYGDIRFSNVEIPDNTDFQDILAKGLRAKSKGVIKSFLEELFKL